MTKQQAIQKTAAFIRDKFDDESTGHDWWHMYRVWQLAKRIAAQENGADMFVVELAALLHDIADWKFHKDEEAGPKAARAWLESIAVDEVTIAHVEDIIRNVSFKGATLKNNLKTLEGQIVHDADKLDAIGAIGIARTFAYGGADKRALHNPDTAQKTYDTLQESTDDRTATINHFYDKLLLLKDRMFTATGKDMAQHRHKVMEQFLDEFYAEWDGKL